MIYWNKEEKKSNEEKKNLKKCSNIKIKKKLINQRDKYYYFNFSRELSN